MNLTGVVNAQTVTVMLNNVKDVSSQVLPDTALRASFLLGGNGSVTSSDVSQTKSQSGHAITAANFRTDVNANGAINGTDVSLVKSKSGTALPP